jgi:hypothetical protein
MYTMATTFFKPKFNSAEAHAHKRFYLQKEGPMLKTYQASFEH